MLSEMAADIFLYLVNRILEGVIENQDRGLQSLMTTCESDVWPVCHARCFTEKIRQCIDAVMTLEVGEFIQRVLRSVEK